MHLNFAYMWHIYEYMRHICSIYTHICSIYAAYIHIYAAYICAYMCIYVHIHCIYVSYMCIYPHIGSFHVGDYKLRAIWSPGSPGIINRRGQQLTIFLYSSTLPLILTSWCKCVYVANDGTDSLSLFAGLIAVFLFLRIESGEIGKHYSNIF